MAYAVERGSRRFVGSGGVVAVHAALAYLLIFGLAPPDFIAPPETRVTGVPVDPPADPPKPEEKQKKEDPKTQPEEQVDAPETPWEFPRTGPTAPDPPLPPYNPGPTLPGGGESTGGGTIEPPLLTPKLARPINDVLRWVTTDDYPRIALRREEQGLARFSVQVDARGGITDCTITRSSGSAALDEATCKNVKRRARFEPATDKYGANVPGTYSNSVNWKLPE